MTDLLAEPTADTKATPKSQRRRRASTGGFALKLDAPARPGYVRRWVVDNPSRIAEMRDLGYDFADEKAGEGKSRTDGLGTRISRHSGTNKEGGAQQLVLMETPQAEYDAGTAEKAERADVTDKAIREGADTLGQLENAYKPAAGSSISHTR